jgi:hypothetical protein
MYAVYLAREAARGISHQDLKEVPRMFMIPKFIMREESFELSK